MKNKLVREKITTPSFDHETKSLAAKSRDILGYRVMSEVVHAPRKLARMLRKLDIQPFSHDSVIAYQQEKLIQAKKELKQSGRSNYSARWMTTPLVEYTDPIPEFVLNKALQIKTALPLVEFGVESIRTYRKDPFLVASLENESYHIEVWDEPKFENDVMNGLIAGEVFEDDDDEEDSSEASSSE